MPDKDKVDLRTDRMLERSVDLVCITGMDGSFRYANPAWKRMLGYSGEELLSRPWRDFIHPDDREKTLAKIRALQKDHRTLGFENRYLHKDGSVRTISWTAVPIREKEQIFCIGRDITDRKRIEENLKASEAEKQKILDSLVEHVIHEDPEMKILWANRAACRSAGMSRDELIGRYCYEIWPRRRSPCPDCPVIRAMSLKKPMELRKITPDGKAWFIRGHPVLDDQGGVIGGIEVTLDITEQKEAEERQKLHFDLMRILNQPEKLETMMKDILRELKGFSGIGAAAIRLPEGDDFCCFQSIGFSKSPEPGKSGTRPPGLSQNPDLKNLYRRVISGETNPRRDFYSPGGSFWSNDITTLPARIIGHHSPGGRKYRSVALIPLKSGKQVVGILQFSDRRKDRFTPEFIEYFENIGGSIGIAFSIKRAEEALVKSEAMYRSLIENSNDMIYLLYDRRFEIINRKFEQVFGYTLEEVNHKDFDFIQLVAPRSRAYVEERKVRSERGEELEPKYEFTAICKDGREIEVETSVSYIPYKEGIATQGIIRDITERKRVEEEKERLQEQLVRSQKMEALARLTGGVAHDFNNLLTVISGYSDLVLRALKKENPQREQIQEIARAASRAAALTGQLLAFSKRQPMVAEHVDLGNILRELGKMIRRIIGENIRLEIQLDPNLKKVRADRTQMEQIIMNLVVNAHDAMPGGGTLAIRAENAVVKKEKPGRLSGLLPGDYVRLQFEDSGPGVDREIQSKLFDPFFTTKPHGTGLGLSVVHGIVEKHGGRIDVRSEPEKGAVFTIFLPVSIRGGEKGRDSGWAEFKPGREGTVLLVEDEVGIQKMIGTFLNRHHYQVLMAGSIAEGRRIFQFHRDQIQLLLSDVVLPDGDGFQLAEELAALRDDLPVILASGYTEEIARLSQMNRKNFMFLKKPFRLQQLLETIRQVI